MPRLSAGVYRGTTPKPCNSFGNDKQVETTMTQTINGTADPWANKYRGATVQDLDPPPALSTSPYTSLSSALMTAFERDYTHLTVIHPESKALLGYLSIPRLRQLLETRQVKEEDMVLKAMIQFERKGRRFRLITPETSLEDLDAFFEGKETGSKQDFAVVTDPARRFVLGVATREDLHEFVNRRPA